MIPALIGRDARLMALVASLRRRWKAAERSGDAEAKQALFKEAVYLGIQPRDYQSEPGQTAAPDSD